ncbi:hypothetical protein NUW54_g113 [Trametes sanguinea]|uniref:Uncharacterized protein n=1 Tax=Trametes sanguinea TaxID=158606 RepID=A0ACC1QA24_9APHY|nr:hypothetical protein NUW54_g113 [Trametes sanguinea]
MPSFLRLLMRPLDLYIRRTFSAPALQSFAHRLKTLFVRLTVVFPAFQVQSSSIHEPLTMVERCSGVMLFINPDPRDTAIFCGYLLGGMNLIGVWRNVTDSVHTIPVEGPFKVYLCAWSPCRVADVRGVRVEQDTSMAGDVALRDDAGADTYTFSAASGRFLFFFSFLEL